MARKKKKKIPFRIKQIIYNKHPLPKQHSLIRVAVPIKSFDHLHIFPLVYRLYVIVTIYQQAWTIQHRIINE